MKKRGLFRNLGRRPGSDQDDDFNHLNAIEKDMIKGIVELSETTVKEVMLPRIDVVFLPEDTSMEDMLDIIVDSGYSRFPVYQETIDNVIGILYVKDVLKNLVKSFAFTSSVIPVPLSVTSIRMASPKSVVVTSSVLIVTTQALEVSVS